MLIRPGDPPNLLAPPPPVKGSLQGLIEATSNFGTALAADCASLCCDWAGTAGTAASSEPKINAALIDRSVSGADKRTATGDAPILCQMARPVGVAASIAAGE